MKKKLTTMLICLIFVVIFNFLLPRLMPGDPVLMILGLDDEPYTQEEYDYYREVSGLDLPLYEQFYNYLSDLCSFDLGYSYYYKADVSSLIASRIPATLNIAIPSLLISSILALILGCLLGVRKNSKLESGVSILNILFDAFPSFLLGLILILIFAVKLDILPMASLNSLRVQSGTLDYVLDRIWHLILPVMTLVISTTPPKYFMLLNSVSAETGKKYVLYAKSRGISDNRIAFFHIFPNICQPYISMVGLSFGYILSGSLIIETIFSINGMGMLISDAISARDFPVLSGALLVSALLIIALNIITDIICYLTDPKVRYSTNEV